MIRGVHRREFIETLMSILVSDMPLSFTDDTSQEKIELLRAERMARKKAKDRKQQNSSAPCAAGAVNTHPNYRRCVRADCAVRAEPAALAGGVRQAQRLRRPRRLRRGDAGASQAAPVPLSSEHTVGGGCELVALQSAAGTLPPLYCISISPMKKFWVYSPSSVAFFLSSSLSSIR